jgi:hypothetical protein
MNVLQFHDRFKAAGFTEQQTQLLDELQRDTIEQAAHAVLIAGLATTRDLKDAEVGLKRDLKEVETCLRHDMKEVETCLRHDMKEMETKLTRDIKELETNLTYKIGLLDASVKGQIAESNLAYTRWVVGFGCVLSSLMIGILIKLL